VDEPTTAHRIGDMHAVIKEQRDRARQALFDVSLLLKQARMSDRIRKEVMDTIDRGRRDDA
jgi:hypothetical protein